MAQLSFDTLRKSISLTTAEFLMENANSIEIKDCSNSHGRKKPQSERGQPAYSVFNHCHDS